MAPTALTTEQGLKNYLEARFIEYISITLLTGGTANFVYRVSLASGKTIVYKHAASYLHSSPSFAFDPTRMDYEDRALEILPPLLSQHLPASRVHAVKRYSYDQEAKLLCIEDGGDQNLKTAYADPKLNIPVIGQELGEWIAALHLCSTETSLSPLASQEPRGNNPIAVSIYRHSYKNLHLALSEYGHDPNFGERINEEFGSKLSRDDEIVCHGDFWPGNVLFKFKDSDEKDFDLTVVDWEMVRRGTSATDVGQFAAEAFLLDRFRGGKGLLPAFLNAYAQAREKAGSQLNNEWVRRVVVHCAVHIAFWPTRVEWTDREGTQKLVDIGVTALRAAVYGDFEQLFASELLKGAGAVWKTILLRA